MRAKRKLTILWSILFALVMVVGMLPIVSLAAEPATATADFSSDPATALDLINAAKTGAEDSTWDPGTNTLTLNGVNFTTTAPKAVILPEAAKIVLNGDNTIIGGDATSVSCFGINALGDLTIEGAGTLTVTSGNSTDQTEQFSCCIYANNNLIISGTVTATGGSASYISYGIYAQDVAISGIVTATGGTSQDGSYGIVANNLSITGTVTATGGTASYGSHGIGVIKDVYISESARVTATGGTVTDIGDGEYYGSYGIFANNDFTISGTAQATAIGSTAPTKSYGIMAGNNMIVSETAQITATGSNGSVYCPYGSKNIAGHTITFDVAGGIGYMEASTGGPTAYILPANSFTAPEGRLFKCWSVNGVEQAVGASVDITADTTVTAVWGVNVSFDANGGTGEMVAQIVVPGEYSLPENGFAAPEGKQFKGWATSADGEIISGTAIDVSADTTLYAVWEDIPAEPKEYDILDGEKSNWTHNSDEDLSIRGSGAFSEFVDVKIDGTLIDSKNYTVEEGSTIVTLKANYLNTLTVGSHNVEIVWTDGSASTKFTIRAQATESDTQSSQTDGRRTGLWTTMFVVWIVGILVFIALIVGLIVNGKKMKKS